jgi:eukaryotic-like serine/threonine-protein kinase
LAVGEKRPTFGAELEFPSEAPLPLQAQVGPGEQLLIGTVVAGRYFVKKLLGTGGMGAVYEAEHVQLKKRVALKVLHGHMSVKPEVQARFEREAVAAGRINHPGVAAATDFGRLPDGAFYLVLEYVDGSSLADVLLQTPVLPLARAFRITVQICAALVAAHGQGIVHRDLKPDNVMLSGLGEEDFVKVLDFGIAKMASEEPAEGQARLTRAGLVFGTPEYMSPEQARGAFVDHRTDLYALGMIAYEMFAGRSAFRADDLMAILTAQMTDPPPPLPTTVPPPLAIVILSLLEKDPEKRPQTAQAAMERLALVAKELGLPMPVPRSAAASQLDIFHMQPKVSIATTALNSIRSLSLRPPGSPPISGWIPALALILGLLGGAFFVVQRSPKARQLAEDLIAKNLPGGQQSPQAASPPAEPPGQLDLAEEQLRIEARQGDREKLGELRKLVEQDRARVDQLVKTLGSEAARQGGDGAGDRGLVERQVSRLLALGRGYSVILHYSGALSAYEDAVRLDPHLAEDAELLVDVRMALGERDTAADGVRFAKTLGSIGADMIFDVYVDHKGQAGMSAVVKQAQDAVKSDAIRAQATSALLVAMDLDRAHVCAEYRELIPRALLYGDTRSVPKLKALRPTHGCGAGARADCFPCLRGEEVPLADAIEQASLRPSPSFLDSKP